MKQGKFYKLLDILEDIKKVDAMIKLHSEKDESTFMLNQYQARKDKLAGALIDELASPSMISPTSIRTIQLIINKFYPNLDKTTLPKSDDFAQLQMAI